MSAGDGGVVSICGDGRVVSICGDGGVVCSLLKLGRWERIIIIIVGNAGRR